jgi:BirA family transcriptional regulator, biotin operon repressor / biotin---[acetyl-CoA-carboxylase] ligase
MISFNFIRLQEVSSTNTYLKEIASDARVSEGTVIMADYQTAGKGQGGNKWFSEAGLNLTISILLRPSMDINRCFFLNEFISIALTDMLKIYGISASIKWPNDIYIGDKKVAGILIENVVVADKILLSVTGIGINVNQVTFSEDLPNPVSLAQLLGKSVDLTEVMNHLLKFYKQRYSELKDDEFTKMHSEYNALLFKKGEPIRYSSGSEIFGGILTEVNEEGELLIKSADDSNTSFQFGEIQLLI